jgi:hypothetical protein
MRIIQVLQIFFGILLSVLVATPGARALQLCSNSQLEDFSLYVYQPGEKCWTNVKYLGVREGTFSQSVNFEGAAKYKRRSEAQFLIAIQRTPDYETSVVVKERVYSPGSIKTDDQKRPRDRDATPDVSLERPAVSNRCGNWTALRSGASVDLNVYNRYHSSGYIPQSGDLRQFHYLYPQGTTDCRGTSDYASANRAQFAFPDLNVAPDSPYFAWVPSIISVGHAENPVYLRLKARNLFVKARQPAAPDSSFALIPFRTQGEPYTRSEFTVADLEHQDTFSKHWPKTWQVEWVP